jgi:hypothetical protein
MVFLALRLTLVVWLVADCGLLSYQITENNKRVVTLQISTNTAINYTTGYSQLIIIKMQIDRLLLEMESNLANYNAVKEIVLSRLLTDKVITEEQAKTYSEKWNIIVIKPSWFERWCTAFSKKDADWMFKFVRFED